MACVGAPPMVTKADDWDEPAKAVLLRLFPGSVWGLTGSGTLFDAYYCNCARGWYSCRLQGPSIDHPFWNLHVAVGYWSLRRTFDGDVYELSADGVVAGTFEETVAVMRQFWEGLQK